MRKVISIISRISLFVSVFFVSGQALSEVKVFETKIGSADLKEVRERITPELYIFSADGELKMRALGYEERVAGDVIEVLTSGKTLYTELTGEQLESKISELKTKAAKNLELNLKKTRPNLPRNMYGSMIKDQNRSIESAFKLPLFSQAEIAKHIQNTDINAQKLEILANDKESYLLVSYSADWCEPCHILSKELLTYFQEQQKNVNVNWVKLER